MINSETGISNEVVFGQGLSASEQSFNDFFF